MGENLRHQFQSSGELCPGRVDMLCPERATRGCPSRVEKFAANFPCQETTEAPVPSLRFLPHNGQMSRTSSYRSAISDPRRVNVADRLSDIARRQPDAIAVAAPGRGDVAGQNSYRTCTFTELHGDASALAHGLVRLGAGPGTRLVLLVRPGCEFVKLVFALLRSGATTVLIDPGMGRKHLMNCLAAVEPDGFVAISPAQAVRAVLRRRFPRARINVTLGRRWFWGGKTYQQLLHLGQRSTAELPQPHADDPAAIIYTSGSTGPPKGVLYTHQMFDTQVGEISQQYDIRPGGFDLACFPLFGLFNSAMGVTTVFPDIDFSRPASADPAKLLAAASDWKVTQAFASPAVWKKLSQYCADRGEQIPTLRTVFSCGAPVPATVLQRTLDCVSAGAEMHTPYGATESLPIASIEAAEVLRETSQLTDEGAGVCVGRKFGTVDWRVIRITDGPIGSIDACEELPVGEIGELIVRGPQVSPEYVVECRAASRESPDNNFSTCNSQLATDKSRIATGNAVAKIPDGDTIWHRMGDVGYFDEQQRFWYCGRKAHRVVTADGTLFTVPCEAVFNTLPQVERTALVGVGPRTQQAPVLIVEIGEGDRAEVLDALLHFAQQHEGLRGIQTFLFHGQLPVDVRHNSKINREQLAEWAALELGNGRLQPGDNPYNLHTYPHPTTRRS